MHLHCIFRTDAVLLDIRLVFCFRHGDVVVVCTVEILNLHLIVCVGIRLALHAHGVFRARNDKIVIRQIIQRGQVRNIGRTVAGQARITVWDDFQTALGKHRRRIGLLQQFGNIALCFLLLAVNRA